MSLVSSNSHLPDRFRTIMTLVHTFLIYIEIQDQAMDTSSRWDNYITRSGARSWLILVNFREPRKKWDLLEKFRISGVLGVHIEQTGTNVLDILLHTLLNVPLTNSLHRKHIQLLDLMLDSL